MNLLIIGLIMILSTTMASASDFCSQGSDQLLNVTKFLPSADSKTTAGICYVKVNSYSWDYSVNNSQIPHEIEVAAKCNSKDFLEYNGKIFINGSVSYFGFATKCETNRGCQYMCRPVVELWSF